MNKFFVMITMLALMMGYQNCSNSMSFDAGEQLVAKVGDESDTGDGSNTYDGVIEEIADEIPTETPHADPAAPTARHRDRSRNDGEDCDDKDRVDQDHANHSSNSAGYVCVLEGEGHGNSIRLGLSASRLSSDTSTINDICMSKKACEEVVSKAYAVKGASKRGYCGNGSANGNGRQDIVTMSDAQVEEAVAQELLKRMMSSNK